MTEATTGQAVWETPHRRAVGPAGAQRFLGLIAAASMVCCSGVHLVAAGYAARGPGWHVLLMLGMALVCLPCAVHAVLAPAPRVWKRAAALAGGMLVAHPVVDLLSASAMPGMSGRDHGGMTIPAVVAVGTTTGPAVTLLLALVALGAGQQRGSRDVGSTARTTAGR